MSDAPNRIEIPMFPAGKRIALTTSWDDGTVHDRRLVAGFNDYGIKGTFNLNSGYLNRPGYDNPGSKWASYIDAAEVAGLYAGHEVAIHTVTHPWLDRLDASQIATEVLEDRKALEDLVGYPVRGMAYPYGTYNRQVIEVLRALGVVYSRTCENQHNPWVPEEPLRWASTCHMLKEGCTADFVKWYESGGSGLYYVWGHSYEFDRKTDWGAMERIFKPMAGKPEVWYCTNIELFDYETARRRLVIAANRRTAWNPSSQTVWLKVAGKLVAVSPGQTARLDASEADA